jgi:glycosyltransferase involved in cell wall biosynthesis/SAM-dependent methyltransferase
LVNQAVDLVFDGERFIPGAGVGIAYEHWARYALAAEAVRGRDVLEVACGEGYGAAFLARSARSVLAFDASEQAVAHARTTYSGTGVRFEQATVRDFFERCEGRFDAVTAFEVIEHLTVEDQSRLLDGIRRVLRPGGFALVSTPDKLLYTDRSLSANPFHIREYYRDEFEAELRARFANVQILDEQVFTGCAIVHPGAERARAVQMVWTDLTRAQGTCKEGLKTSGEYLVALLGNDPLPEIDSVVLADFSRKLIAEGLIPERRTADRLSRELEEARRAWQAAIAEGAAERAKARATAETQRAHDDAQRAAGEEARRMRATLEEARQDAARDRAALEEARRDAARDRAALEQARRDVAQAQAALEESRLDASRARAAAQAEHSRAEAVLMRVGPAARKVASIERRFSSIAHVLGEVPKKNWIAPRAAAQSLREARRRHSDRRCIEESGLFDASWYLATYPDIKGVDPLSHYLQHGAAEGRDPHPFFDTSFYVASYPDVASAGVNPLVHFIAHGWKELRRPHPGFDTGFYLDAYPDVRQQGVNPLVHYVRHGALEGRAPRPGAAGGPPLGGSFCGATGSRLGPAVERWHAEMAALPRRALVVDSTLPTPDRDSGSITTLENMKALQALGYAVTFVPHDLCHEARYADALTEAGFWLLTGPDVPSVHALLAEHGRLFDVVLVARVPVACHVVVPVATWCPEATLLFETMDLHFLREEREAELRGTEDAREQAATTKQLELGLVRRADATIVHSTHELEVLERAVPGASAHLLPYVIEPRGRGPAFEARRDLLFLGGFRHKPNVDAVQVFARDVLPLVQRELPDVRFVIVGSDPPEEVLGLASESVVVTGYVEDLKPIFDATRVSVAPLRYGAGYKGKVAMSMAHGVPGVVTSIAAEGMELRDGEQLLIADEPADMAAAIVRLYRDPALWDRLARSSYDFVVERFSPRAARRSMERILRAAGAPGWGEAPPPASAPAPAAITRGAAIFPSRFMRELHRRAGVQYADTTLVPHGVDFLHAPDAPRADRSRLVTPGILSLLFAGRITHFKGVHTALEALPAIAAALPDLQVRLTVLGDGSDEAYVQRIRSLASELPAGSVRFEPPAGEEDLFAVFQRHDLYLFPSLFEPFALTLILALEAGIPTVASAAGGNVDLVVDHDTGLLFPAGDARALANAVIELAANPSLRQALSAAGRAAAGRLTVDRMVDQLEEVLERAAAREASQ